MTKQPQPFADFDNAPSTAGKVTADALLGDQSNALVPVEETEDASALVQVEYSSDTSKFKKGQFSYPQLSLVQPTGPQIKEGMKAGDYHIPGYPPMDKLQLVFLKFGYGRSYNTGSGKMLVVHCTSNDGEIGNGDNGEGVGRHSCETCPQAKWHPKPGATSKGKGNNLPPACTDFFRYVVFVVPFGILAEYRMQKTAMKTAQNINSMMINQGAGNFILEMGSIDGQSDYSNTGFKIPNFMMVIPPTRRADPEGRAEYEETITRAKHMGGIKDEVEDLDVAPAAPITEAQFTVVTE